MVFPTKSPDRGTGLGLSSVAELVKRIGGKIEFESEPGLGTSMTVSLPRVDDPFPHAVKEAAKLAELPPLKVLIVDDNDALRQTLAYVFALRGHTVKTSAGIERAMELLQSSPFDVLVTDILLADGTGDELVEQARSKYPTLNVVYMSGFTEDSTETLQLDNLHTSFIPKPFHPNQLISVIAEQVDSAV